MEDIIRDVRQLGHAVRRQRESAGLTQGDLARKAGLRQPTVSDIEGGVAGPRFDTVAALLAALDLELVLRPRTRTEGDLSAIF